MGSRAAPPSFPFRAEFCALRAPLLPTSASAPLPGCEDPEVAVLEARAAWARRASASLADPRVREALWLASPDLDRAVDLWLTDPQDPRAEGVLVALYRYLARMSRRATPFGLCAGLTTGSIGARTSLRLAGELRAHTRLDAAWLEALAAAVEVGSRDALVYSASSSLYRAADQLRYAVARVDAQRVRANDQVALTRTPAVDAVLAAAPARRGALAEAVRAAYPEVDPDDARAFVDGLIDAGLLVSELAPPIVGDDPFAAWIDRLRAARPELAADLAALRAALIDFDRAAPGRPAAAYAAIAQRLATSPAPPDPRRLFHVDLYRAGEVVLGPEVVRAIEEAVEVLRRITPAPTDDPIADLREAFATRFGGGAWPLTCVLDEERGAGFASAGHSADPSPLLAGLPPLGGGAGPPRRWTERDQHLLRRVVEAGPGGEWRLDEADLAALATREPPPLPDAFAFVGALAAEDAAACERGEFRLHVQAISGPSGARLLGRFCLGDPVLRGRVEAHLRAEEAWAPDALFAEVVHRPEGRAGNVLGRPALRAWEIPYLGCSGAPEAQRLPLDDLVLGFEGERVRLWSRRHGREVVPRLTSAHNHGAGDLPIYRFLGRVQGDGVASVLGWSWGALETAPFLPRVSWGQTILAPARWHLAVDELAPLRAAQGAARLLAARALRARRALPRQVQLVQGDQVLAVDLDDAVALEALLAVTRDEARVGLAEDPGDAACVEGPEGRYAHELVVPFVRVGGPPRRSPPLPSSAATRAWPPGSPWLYAKIYAGTVTTDAVIAELVAPLVAELRAEGLLAGWFFVRYADPDWHLRLRLRLVEGAGGRASARLHDALAPWLADRRVWRVVHDTYQPEVERYGGDEGIGPSERLFEADSDAAAAIVAGLAGDEGSDARWRLGLRGTHLLLADFEVPLERREALLEAWREDLAARLGADQALGRALSARYRQLRPTLEPLLRPVWDPEDPLAPGLEILEGRSEASRPIVAALRAARLSAPLEQVLGSHVHMAMNRILRAELNAQEMVVYDLLARLYRSERARQRSR